MLRSLFTRTMDRPETVASAIRAMATAQAREDLARESVRRAQVRAIRAEDALAELVRAIDSAPSFTVVRTKPNMPEEFMVRSRHTDHHPLAEAMRVAKKTLETRHG